MKNRQLTQQQIRAYAHYLQMEEKSGATMEKYLRDIQAFACWLDGRDISKELTSEWKGHLISQDYAPTTVNAMLSALNSLLEFLDLRECRVKFLKIQRRLFRDADRELTKDDYQRLLNTAHKLGKERLGLLVETIGATGIRVSEVAYHRRSCPTGQSRNRSQRQDPHHPAPRKTPSQAAEVCEKTKNRLRRDLSHQKRKGTWPPTDLGGTERAVQARRRGARESVSSQFAAPVCHCLLPNLPGHCQTG